MAALAKLVYSPFIELLHGTVGTKEVLVWAASGGSRGSTDKKRWKETKASYKKLMDLLSGAKNEYRGVLVVENDSSILLSD